MNDVKIQNVKNHCQPRHQIAMCVLIFTLTLTSMPKKNRARSSHIEDILGAEKRIFHPFLSRSSLVHGKLSNMKWLLSRLTRSGGSDEYSHDTISQSDSDPQMISIEQNILIATAEAIESICIDKNDPTLSLSLSLSLTTLKSHISLIPKK